MTATIILSITVAGLAILAAWAIREARQEGKVAIAAARKELEQVKAGAELRRLLAVAETAVAQRTAELANALARVAQLEDALAAARRDLTDERLEEIHGATDADLPAVVDGLLEARRAEVARRAAGDRSDAAGHAVPRAGADASATDRARLGLVER